MNDIAHLQRRLLEAADVLRRLPVERPAGYRSNMPEPVHDPAEAYGWDGERPRPAKPTPEEISRLDEVLAWTAWLAPYERVVVWARAQGIPWRAICRRLNCSRPTATRIHRRALEAIIQQRKLRESSGKQRKN